MNTSSESIYLSDMEIVSPDDEKDYQEFKYFCGNELTDLAGVLKDKSVYSIETTMDDVSVELIKNPISAKPVEVKEKPGKEINEESITIYPVRSKFLGILNLNNEKNVPYVKVGDSVKTGQILASVMNMNINNRIDSPVDGEVVQILEDGGKPVEYGQILFMVQ